VVGLESSIEKENNSGKKLLKFFFTAMKVEIFGICKK
jgi:hypothetical protein